MYKIKYEFSARVYLHKSPGEVYGWVLVSLPSELAVEIRGSFKHLEEGWGRMRVEARLGESEWQTAIWFDTKQNTYLLPLKAKIRKQENVLPGDEVKITIEV
jgi:Domain of unknown function (DUF1905).